MSSFTGSFSSRRTSHAAIGGGDGGGHGSDSSNGGTGSNPSSPTSRSAMKSSPHSSLVKELPGYQSKTPLLFSSPNPSLRSSNSESSKMSASALDSKPQSSYKNREYLYWERGFSGSSSSSSSSNSLPSSSTNSSTSSTTRHSELSQQQQQHNQLIDNDHNNSQGLPPTATLSDLRGMFSNPVLMSGGSGLNTTANQKQATQVFPQEMGEHLRDERSLSTLKDLSPRLNGDEKAFWISVFGFSGQLKNSSSPTNAVIDGILDVFEQLGDMLPPTLTKEELIRSSIVNGFINIGFRSKWSAQRALEMNGQILQIPGVSLDNGLMIGCIPMQKAMAEVERIGQASFLSPVKRESLKNDLKGPFVAGIGTTGTEEDMILRTPFTPHSGLIGDKQQLPASSSSLSSPLKSPSLKVPRSLQKGLDYVFGWK